MRIGNCAAKCHIAYAGCIKRIRNTLQKSRTDNTSAALMDQYLRSAEFLYKLCNPALRILAENNLGRCKILKIKHEIGSFHIVFRCFRCFQFPENAFRNYLCFDYPAAIRHPEYGRNMSGRLAHRTTSLLIFPGGQCSTRCAVLRSQATGNAQHFRSAVLNSYRYFT